MKRLSFIFSALWLIVATHAYAGGIVVGPIGGVPSGVTNGTGVDSGPIGPSSPAGVPTIGGVPASPYANFASSLYYYNGVTYGDLPTWLTALGGTFTRASNATYTNSAGLLATASSNVARFDYNPSTLAANGILLEGSRTNIVLHSQAFGGGNWGTNSIASVTDNATTGPDGTASAALITESAGSGAHIVSMRQTSAANTTYSHSIWIQMGTRRFVGMNIAPAATDWIAGVFDLQSGVVGEHAVGASGTFVSSNITAYPNNWYRIQLVGTTGADANPFIEVYAANAASGNTFGSFGEITAADGGKTFSLYGGQAEIASFPSSYIATTTGSVTRAADSLTFPFTDSGNITGLVTHSSYGILAAGNEMLGLYTGSTMRSEIFISVGGADLQYFDKGTDALVGNLVVSPSVNTLYKSAFSETLTSCQGVANAGSVVSASGFSARTLSNTVDVGFVTGAPQYSVWGTVGQVGLWSNVAASSADLTRLTQ